MKIIHRLSLHQDQELEKYLTDLGFSLKINETQLTRSVFCTIEDNDPRWTRVRDRIEGTKTWAQHGLHYEPKDYEQAQWFWLLTSESAYPQPEEDFKSVTYNLDHYCHLCGVGAIQDRPFRFRSDIPVKSPLMGIHWVFDALFCRPEAKQLLEKEKLTGITFSHPVYHKSGQSIETLYQIEIKTTLPPGYVLTENEDIVCEINNKEYQRTVASTGIFPSQAKENEYCGQTKYFFPEVHPLTFKKEIFNMAPDFVHTSEWFGGNKAPYRLIIVSKKVYTFVTSQKWKSANFKPITLI